jgi:hypothetical protein
MAKPGIAGLAAVASGIAASSCFLPLFPFPIGVALAGTTAFLAAARPYLLGASVAFLTWSFYQGFRARQCNRRPGAANTAVLGLSTLFVAAAVLFPQAMCCSSGTRSG